LFYFWLNYVREEYRKTRRYMLLAIDIPKNNEQTPKAVENVFSHLAGAHQKQTRVGKWWNGEINDSFSFEIVSIGGYIQFIVHTRDVYRDLVEAVVYAQYPDAEITEVEDYTEKWKLTFPNEKYELFGTEIVLARNEVYPVITYTEFEDSISQQVKDPMASLLEALSRINPGEEIWLQFVVTPADNDWGDRAKPVIDKIIGAKSKPKKNIIDYLFDIPNILIDAINPVDGASSSSDGGKEEPNQLMYLTDGEKETVKAIQHKTSKIGFHVKIRYIYIAEKDKYLKQRGLQGIYGAFKQFNSLGLNSFKPDASSITGGLLWFKKPRIAKRQRNMLDSYKNRGQHLTPGEYGYILNTEELASLWHFPVLEVKTPLLKKTESKKSEPPMSLPIDIIQPIAKIENDNTAKAEPPTNLPIG